MFQWFQQKTQAPRPTAHAQYQFEIRRQTANLISAANRVEPYGRKTPPDTTNTQALQASQSVVVAQNALVEAIIDGFCNGLSFDHVIKTGVQPALDAGVVTDLAAFSVETTLRRARDWRATRN